VEEVLDAADAAAMGTNRLDQPRRQRIDAPVAGRIPRLLRKQRGGDLLIRRRIRRAKGRHLPVLDVGGHGETIMPGFATPREVRT
jgi:hypothetical protein